MQDRLMVFVDDSNLLRATSTNIQARIQPDKPNKDAINLCSMIVDTLVTRIAKEASFYDCKIIHRYWFGSVQGNEEYELINAINGNYDLALLVADDEDYVNLLNHLKRFGVRMIGSFYDISLSEHLKLAVDYFHQFNIWGSNRKELVEALCGVLPK